MQSRPLTIAVIPSRYASTRLPAKPLIDLKGKTMVQRVYERTKQASLIDRVIVATDHDAIAEAVSAFGGEVMMTPESLRSGTDRVAYVAERIPEAELIVNVQGDEPLIVPAMIDQAVAPLINDPLITMGTLAKRIENAAELNNPAVVKVVIAANGNALYFSRSPLPHLRDNADTTTWPASHAYYKHVGLYIYRRTLLLEYASWPESPLEQAEKLEQLRMLERGGEIHVAITEFNTVSIDTPDDVRTVTAMLEDGAL